MESYLYQASVLVLPIVIAITFHEAAHGWVAWQLGDDTARRLGRVTFNPLRHIDPFGTVILPALLYFSMGFPFGWAKPVPVDARRLGHPHRDMVWVALAGPGVNILLAFLAGGLLHATDLLGDPGGSWLRDVIWNFIIVNAVLAVFNLIPLLPLDGGRAVVGLLPERLARPVMRLERAGLAILLALLVLLPAIGAQIGINLQVLPWLIQEPVRLLIDLVLRLSGNL